MPVGDDAAIYAQPMKKPLSLLAATGLIAGSLLATAAPAHAEAGDTDVTLTSGISAKDLVISAKKCTPIRLSMSFRAQPADAAFDLVVADLLIWAAGNSTPWEELLVADGRDRVLSNDNELIEPWQWCPTKGEGNVSGLGKFTVTGDYLRWWEAGTWGLDEDDEWVEEEDVPDPLGERGIATQTSFTVKQASKVSSAKISKKGSKRTISAKFTYFDITKKAKKEWTVLPKGTKVELQRRAANGSGTWKKIKTVKVGSKGAVKTTYKTKTTYQYRFVYAGSTTKAAVGSKVLKK